MTTNNKNAAAELLSLLETDFKLRASHSLLPFVMWTKPDYEVNWHHKTLCRHLDRFIRRETKRLMVFMPPRYGKSELVSRRLPAFIFGQNPNASIIATSYSADLASRMNRDVQRIIDSPEYASLFPLTTISGENAKVDATGTYLRNNDIFEIVGHRGTYRAAGVGGGITGMGGEYILIDDPIKNQEEADSEIYRERLWEWYSSTLYTRLEKDACILLTMTRWHEDDLAGRLLKLSADDPNSDQWTIVNFPAIKEAESSFDPRLIGNPLWPAKFPLDQIQRTKASVGSRVWNSLYQQRPTAAEGNIIRRQWLKFYERPPETSNFDEIIQSWDLTFSGKSTSDYVVGQVWGRLGSDKYLLDQVRERMGISQTISQIIEVSSKWRRSNLKLVENKANGPAIEDLLKHKVSGIVLWEPKGDKTSRLNAIAPQFEAGNIYLPATSRQPWILDFVDEITAFPTGVNDDQVDACTMALLRLEESNSASVGRLRVIRGPRY